MRLTDRLMFWRKNSDLDEDLQSLERRLHERLVPVEPRPKFVSDLRDKLLMKKSAVELASPKTSKHRVLQTGLLVTSGVLGSIVVVTTGIRGVISLIGVAGLLVSWIRQDSQKTIQTTNLSPH